MQSEVASLGKPGDGAKAGFLGGTHSVRPRIRVGRKPGHNIIIKGAIERPVAQWGGPSVQAKPYLRACGARPSAGRPSDGEKALRGQTRR
jgi:hypothetical protein